MTKPPEPAHEVEAAAVPYVWDVFLEREPEDQRTAGLVAPVMIDVLIDAVDGETGGATGRSKADAPEIDGEVHLRDAGGLKPGDIVPVRVEDADEHDLFGVPA